MLNTILGSLSSGVAASTSSYESIASVTAAGGETSITFSSIVGTYASLQLRVNGKANAAAVAIGGIQFNGDTGSNYSWHRLNGDGSSAAATGNNGVTSMQAIWLPDNSSSYFGTAIVDILDYASTTKNKTTRTFNGYDTNGAGRVQLFSGARYSTSAVTSITITIDALYSGSTFALYGIKG